MTLFQSTPPNQGGLPGAIADDAVFQTLLSGLQGSFKRALGLKSCLFTFNDAYKDRIANDKRVEYPRCTVKISTLELLNNLNNLSLGREGIRSLPPKSLDLGLRNGVLRGGNTVPMFNGVQVKGYFELHLLDNDRKRSFSMMGTLLMLIASRRLGFSVILDDTFEYQAQPVFDLTVPIPDQELAATNDKGLIDLALPFTAQGYVGRLDKVQRAIKANYQFSTVASQ